MRRLETVFCIVSLLVLSGANVAIAANELQGPLEGHAELTDVADTSPSLVGHWKLHLKQLHRHPSIDLTSHEGNHVSGTYKGLIGTFPVNGTVAEDMKGLKLYVDFSRSILARRKKHDSLIAVFNANLNDDKREFVGSASIPELSDRIVNFTARRQDAK